MFSKKHRLSKTADIQRVFAKGRAFFNPWMSVRFLASPRVRFTVVVSTKVAKSAVRRNRLKRVAREYLRLRLDRFIPGDYAVILKPLATSLEAEALRGKLEELLIKAKLLGS